LPPREALARHYCLAGAARDPSAFSKWLNEVGRETLRTRPSSLPPPDRAPTAHESAPWIVCTALCVEPREGQLFVFMPLTPTTEDYLNLLAAVETTAALRISFPAERSHRASRHGA
jgi:uncharacterized protein (DUF2126 family)